MLLDRVMNTLIKNITIFVLFIGATVVACLLSPDPIADEKIGVEMNLPLFSGEWSGRPMEISGRELEVLPADTEYARSLYSDITGQQVTCSIVLAGADRRSIHRPEVCLPAQGWKIKSADFVNISIKGGRELPAKRLLLSRQVEKNDGTVAEVEAYSYYWFVGNDVVTADQKKRVLITAFDNILRNVNHRWAYVTVMGWITQDFEIGGTTELEAQGTIEKFVQDVVPEFQLVFPEA